MISQTAEYALRAAVHLSENLGTAQSTGQIAKGMKIPAGYLSKVLQTLTRAGIVRSRRGIKGGFSLTRPPERITALDVIQAVDPLHRIRKCPLGRPLHGKNLCPLHTRLDAAVALIEASFQACTLAELRGGPDGAPSVCKDRRG